LSFWALRKRARKKATKSETADKLKVMIKEMDYYKAVKDLCSINTQTGGGGADASARVLQDLLADANLSFRPSASIGCDRDIIFKQKGKGDCKILLLGHYDTVPAAGNQEIRQEKDKVFALGTWDMKGGIVVAADVMRNIPEEYYSELDLLLTGDEENRNGTFKSPGRYDIILSFEGGTREGVVFSRFGAGLLELQLEGKALRAEFPLPETGSIDALLALHNDLRLMNKDTVQFTASNINIHSAINVVPGEVTLSGVLRYQSVQERDLYLEAIKDKHHGFVIKKTFQEMFPPLFPSKESRALLDDLDIYGVVRTGASDISLMSSSARLLFDGLGPLGGGDHTPDEHLLLSSFPRQRELALKIITKAIT
jgi:glutamate carboxypeptidase